MADKSDSEIESERTLAILKQVLMNQVTIMDAMRSVRHYHPLTLAVGESESMIYRINEAEAAAYRKQQERASAQAATHDFFTMCFRCRGTGIVHSDTRPVTCQGCGGTGKVK